MGGPPVDRRWRRRASGPGAGTFPTRLGGECAVSPGHRVFFVRKSGPHAGTLGTPARPGVGPESRGGPSDRRAIGRPMGRVGRNRRTVLPARSGSGVAEFEEASAQAYNRKSLSRKVLLSLRNSRSFGHCSRPAARYNRYGTKSRQVGLFAGIPSRDEPNMWIEAHPLMAFAFAEPVDDGVPSAEIQVIYGRVVRPDDVVHVGVTLGKAVSSAAPRQPASGYAVSAGRRATPRVPTRETRNGQMHEAAPEERLHPHETL